MPPINATLLLTAAIAAVGGPLLGFGPPAEMPPTRRAEAGITIDDGVRHLEAGHAVSYRITARAGDHEPAAAVRLTVPAGLRDLAADGATRNGAHLSWPAALAPGETRSYTADATVDPTAAGDVAVTACLQAAGDASLACATDLDLIVERATSRGIAWLGAAVFGILAALGGIWLHRRIRPELLTPANAHLIFTDPGRPGGAPTA